MDGKEEVLSKSEKLTTQRFEIVYPSFDFN